MQITKEVDLGNDCKITVASLTFDQVEEMMSREIPEDAKSQRARAWEEVMAAVHNVPGQETFTRKNITDELEKAFPAVQAVSKFSDLRFEVMELSGYEVKKNQPETDTAANQ